MQFPISKLLMLIFCATCFSFSPLGKDAIGQGIYNIQSSSDVYVRGYIRKNGTYVKPHYRSRPNSSKSDNWSTRGNTNPYTGRRGTRDPYKNRGSLGTRQPSNSLIEQYYRRNR